MAELIECFKLAPLADNEYQYGDLESAYNQLVTAEIRMKTLLANPAITADAREYADGWQKGFQELFQEVRNAYQIQKKLQTKEMVKKWAVIGLLVGAVALTTMVVKKQRK